MEGDEEMSALPIEGWLVEHPPPSTARLFPHSRRVTGYTVDDWLKLPQTGERIELIDGSFVVHGVPAPNHAICAKRMVRLLDDARPDHLEVAEAVGIVVGEDGLIPDIVIADAEAMLSGIPDLAYPDVVGVVEIVSPGLGNWKRDYEIKPPKYAAAGIPVFIRVELEGEGAPTVEVFQLGKTGYIRVSVAGAGENLTISEPFKVSFDPAVLAGRRRS
ncbi:Uma2 family endonuclease [Nonomuraea sp. NPDC046802]|uniref:Uma2 family endonuclease n=1 Tax=Nonomuraea sp. NPDC046802 TaxID=3154919 RepID=UPI00340C729B